MSKRRGFHIVREIGLTTGDVYQIHRLWQGRLMMGYAVWCVTTCMFVCGGYHCPKSFDECNAFCTLYEDKAINELTIPIRENGTRSEQ